MASDTRYGAALAYTTEMLGGPVVEEENVVSVGTTATVLVDGRGDRVALVFTNVDTVDIMVWITSAVGTTRGIRLTASGGSVSMTLREDFTFMTRRWYGLSTGAGSANLSILELSRFRGALPDDHK